MQVESAEIYARVFRRLKPRTPLPVIEVKFRSYANANAQIKLGGRRVGGQDGGHARGCAG
jgi:hypothetical protein